MFTVFIHFMASAFFLLPLLKSVMTAPMLHREKRHNNYKPQISSGPLPCMDKDNKPKFPPPKDPPWFTDDKCHMSVCAGALVITKSLCFLKGIICPPGSYLNVPPKPSSPADCCICKPYEPLRKRFIIAQINRLKETTPGVRLQGDKHLEEHAPNN